VKRALVCGITGQDGAWLSRLLLEKGYEVHGTSRDAATARLSSLERLGVRDRVRVVSADPVDFRSLHDVLSRVGPDEVYGLFGQTSVGLSFDQPVQTLSSIAVGTLNLLEAVRLLRLPARVYNACSGECFGDTGDRAADERTPFAPRSPYGVAKAAAYWHVSNYREAYGTFACSGILFNHESPLRPERFVTRKIVRAACRIAGGDAAPLRLGSLDVERDWGWAPEYVDAMWRMLQAEEPRDYVIATGRRASLRDFVAAAFERVGLHWERHVEADPSLVRPLDIRGNAGDATRAYRDLGWRARTTMPEVVVRLVDAERAGSAGLD
jgi:GDPmannose 4,6-dehydratase